MAKYLADFHNVRFHKLSEQDLLSETWLDTITKRPDQAKGTEKSSITF